MREIVLQAALLLIALSLTIELTVMLIVRLRSKGSLAFFRRMTGLIAADDRALRLKQNCE